MTRSQFSTQWVSRHSLRAFALMVWMAPVIAAWADVAPPGPADRRIALWVANLLREDHLLRQPLDDTISERAFDLFLDRPRPDEVLLSAVRRRRVSVVPRQYRRHDQKWRRASGSSDVQPLPGAVGPRDQLGGRIGRHGARFHDRKKRWTPIRTRCSTPTTEEELKDRWRRRIKYELLLRQADDMPATERGREKIKRRYQSLSKLRHQTDSEELLEMFLTAITCSYDPHTSYMAKSTFDNFEINMRLNLEGIGAALKPEDGYTVVTKIIPGGAADKHGKLQPEDRIVSVGQGKTGEMVDVVDMPLSDVVDLIRGHAGTVVRLGVISAGETETNVYEIQRARIELKDSEARAQVIEVSEKELFGDQVAGTGRTYKVGVIDLPSFYMDMEGARTKALNYKSSTRDVARILDDFRRDSVDVVLLDLSHNGGGSLTEAIDLTGLFIDRGPVVQIKDADGIVQQYNDDTPGMAWSGPLVVQISKFSASASEILAGAIQDYGRGIIVGDESTHGKGTVQSLQDLGSRLFNVPNPPNYGALKITMQQFYRPNGDSTQKRGVLADVVLPSMTSQFDVGEADLDYAIDFDRIRSARFGKYDRVSADMLQELRQHSQERISRFQRFPAAAAKYPAVSRTERPQVRDAERRGVHGGTCRDQCRARRGKGTGTADGIHRPSRLRPQFLQQ